MEQKEQEIKELNLEEMEQAAGGTFWFNYKSESEYNSAGIEVVSHIIEKDEFWWKGKNIGHDSANMVVFFYEKNGRQPASMAEAINFYNHNRPESSGGGCDLGHLA